MDKIKFIDLKKKIHYIPREFLFYPDGFEYRNLYLVYPDVYCKPQNKKTMYILKKMKEDIMRMNNTWKNW
jgi:hypothetical protein